ncbi:MULTISPECIES: WhiB family transcriptional regulator [unclassified Pseudonocardia]|uniref:WhiB family transcriptional regulator n=1 Tax=unclassified Pseudonocardia TaxID=2619320 RepID=UPI0009EA3B53
MVVRDEARRDWRDHAQCAGEEHELFFPAGDFGPAHDRQVARALAVCAGCPVRAACLAWSVEELPYGIAGGRTAEERGRMRRNRRRRVRRGRVVRPRPFRRRIRAAEDGRAELAAGSARTVVAHRYGVSLRTVERWASEARAEIGGGSR